MADAIKLYLVLSSTKGRLVKSLYDGSEPTDLNAVYQDALLPLRIYPVVSIEGTLDSPLGSGTPQFQKLPIDNMDIWVAIGPAPGAEAIKAAQYTWTKQLTLDGDATVPTELQSGYFYADLPVNTAEMAAALSTSAAYSTTLAFLISRSSSAFSTVYQRPISIEAVVKGPDSPATIPVSVLTPLYLEQATSIFVPYNGPAFPQNNGRGIILTSPDGTHTRELAVTNDPLPTDSVS